MTNLSNRLDKLRGRRTDPSTGYFFFKEAALAKSMATPGAREVLEYISESAAPVSPDYTEKTFAECDRVQVQLARIFETSQIPAEFDHQGSVTNDTHIKLHSDIDLLSITEKYTSLQPPLKPAIPYRGDPLADLAAMRTATINGLRTAYPAAKVDDSKARCVSLSGGSLARKIDVVASNWLDTQESANSGEKAFRGIHVKRISNFPFLHNKRIADRDQETVGGLRRCIRLVKSIRYDSDEDIDFSSYDIASICYNIRPVDLAFESDVSLANRFVQFAIQVLQNTAIRESLSVPNGTRKIFGGPEGASLVELDKLVRETIDLLNSASARAA
jgi:hypothetical protein